MAHHNYLFLDCEWADILASELVSIALVSLDGAHEFYAERRVLPYDPTPWVQATVYPLLDRGERAMDDKEMSGALVEFLSQFDRPHIHYDFPADRVLCQGVIDGGLTRAGDIALIEQLTWQLITDTSRALEEWWSEHPEERSHRHHALHDARALRSAFLSLWGA